MNFVICCAIMIAIVTVLVANVIYFKKAIDCVRQKKPAGVIFKRLRVFFGIFLTLWLAGGILVPHLLGGPFGFTQPILQTIFCGIAGYWIIQLLQKNG